MANTLHPQNSRHPTTKSVLAGEQDKMFFDNKSHANLLKSYNAGKSNIGPKILSPKQHRYKIVSWILHLRYFIAEISTIWVEESPDMTSGIHVYFKLQKRLAGKVL